MGLNFWKKIYVTHTEGGGGGTDQCHEWGQKSLINVSRIIWMAPKEREGRVGWSVLIKCKVVVMVVVAAAISNSALNQEKK